MSTSPNPYLQTKVLTADPVELRQMLLDGAIKFALQGQRGLEERDFEAAYNGISRCQNILMELINGLRPQQEPELCQRLSSLYTFMFTRLMNASTERDPAIVDEVLKLLHFERETWQMVMQRLVEENSDAAAMEATPDAAPTIPTEPDPRGLVGGHVSLRG